VTTAPQKRNPESGFALLFVYAMAATVAIMLLMQMPSAAFEAQRDHEQLLIDRGEQYSRAIQLYVRKFNRYPPDFDALDNTQNQRFLRHHYEDPLTGKEEWRLIHVGPGGVFTDSLLYTKKQDPNAPAKQTFITEMPTVVPDANGSGAGVNLATRRQGNPNDPNSQLPGVTTTNFPNQYQNPLPGQPQQGFVPGFAGTGVTGPGISGQTLPGQSGQLPDPNQPQQSIPGGLPPGVQLPPGTQLPPGIQNPNQNGNNPMTGAAGLINQLLTTPRPGGLGGLATTGTPQTAVDAFGNPVAAPGPGGITAPGIQAGQQGVGPNGQPNGQINGQLNGQLNGQPGAAQQPGMGQTIGGGIAGVASKLEQEGIKRYRERKLYNEWEFVYDITKDSSRAGVGGAGGQQAANPAQAGAAGAQGAAPFGGVMGVTGPNQPAFGQNPFGQNPGQPAQPINQQPAMPPGLPGLPQPAPVAPAPPQ
jgi:hypothetical protein